MQTYVLGFVFDLYAKKVLLMKKNKPDWQKGFFNGIGGKVESDEDKYQAMTRECKEETGADTHYLDWYHFCTMDGINCPDGDWKVFCFCTTLTSPDKKHDFSTNEQELVVWIDLSDLHVMLPKLLGNIAWLVSLALDYRTNGNFNPPVIEYSG